MRRIKIAQIGAGHDHAGCTIRTLKNQSDIFELVGYTVVDEDFNNIDRCSYNGQKDCYDGVRLMTLDEILDYPELDAVCIECEDRTLTKYAQMAADRGLNVHMDKPGGVDDAEFDRLIDTFKRTGKVFHTGYMYRYNPAVMKLKEDIKSGKYGNIFSVEAQMNCLHEPDKRQWLAAYPGGMLYFLGCHLVDLVYSILGEPQEVVPFSTCVGEDGVTAQDFGMAVFKYKNGVSFVKSIATELGGFERRQLVVCGTEGSVEIKPLEHIVDGWENMVSPQVTKVRETLDRSWTSEGEMYTTDVVDRYISMMRSFAAYVSGDMVNPFDYEYERGLHKLILKACGAAK